MKPANHWAVPEPRNGAGRLALQLGMVAVAAAFLPIIGDYIAAPAALSALVLGAIGYYRTEKGVATNAGQAMTGGFLGLTAGFVRRAHHVRHHLHRVLIDAPGNR